jgi:HK97 family phage major capsid protein
MKDQLNKALKSVLEEANALSTEVATREPTEAEAKKMTDLATKATNLKDQIDAAAKLEALKDWGEQSAGSVVKSSFDRIADDQEGNIPGVTSAPNGELYAVDGAYKGVGEKKLAALKSGQYKDAFAEYVRSAGLGRSIKGDAMKVLNEGSDTAGGFWIPPDFRPDLVKRIAAMSTIRPNASVYTTGTDSITFPAANYTTDDKYTSGVRFSWRDSAPLTSDITEATNPIAGQVKLSVNLATAAIILTRGQLEDSAFDILGYITQLMAESFSLGEEDAFTSGDGVGKPVGFLRHPTASIANGSTSTIGGLTYSGGLLYTGDTDDLAWAGIIDTEAALPPQYETGAKWYANKKSYARLRSLNAGTATLPQWGLGDAWPNYANGMQASLLGYGIVKNQFMPDYGASPSYPVMALGDMKGYYIADRVGISVEVFREVYGLRDQVVVYARKRTGGQLVHYWKMKFLTMTA